MQNGYGGREEFMIFDLACRRFYRIFLRGFDGSMNRGQWYKWTMIQ